MNKHIAKLITLHIKDKHKRWLIRQELIEGRINPSKIKLYMTLVVKNEEDIIEKNILFHKKMGVDGFIVTNHNSTDNTLNILEKLKKDGIVKEIITYNCIEHKHNKWVHKMIKIAKHKYKADWIINADADEFYYSKDLNLKKSIAKYPRVNVFHLDSNFVFADNTYSTLNNPYFIKNPLNQLELKKLQKEYDGIDFNEYSMGYLKACPKVIHALKGYIKIESGNHNVEMKNKIMAETSDIVLYHYHIPNIEAYKKKAKRWGNSAKYLTKGENYLTKLINLEKENKLEDLFKKKYNNKIKEFLIDKGILAKDYSVAHFIEEIKI